MHKAPDKTSLTEALEAMARAKWTNRNVWLRPCHAKRCKEHTA